MIVVARPWRRRAGSGRRSGPAGEERWWDPADQEAAERPLLQPRDLGRGWQTAPMWNNAERWDPHGDDPASAVIRAARDQRRLTALDEGAAWRRFRDGTLLVARVEVFADAEAGSAHRQAWQEHAERSLDAVWRARWRERGREPGWIEARWRADVDRPDQLRPDSPVASPAAAALDWVTIEDHTGVDDAGELTAYEHLTLWAGRGLVTLTLRHRHGDDADEVVAAAVVAAWRSTDGLSRRSGPARGSA